jgi:hypothetical protein
MLDRERECPIVDFGESRLNSPMHQNLNELVNLDVETVMAEDPMETADGCWEE